MTSTRSQLARLARTKPRSIHEQMAQRRRMLGLSRAGMAAHLGVSARTLESWEQGRRLPGHVALATWHAELERLEGVARRRVRKHELAYDPQLMDTLDSDRLGKHRR